VLGKTTREIGSANSSLQPFRILFLDDNLFDRTKLRRLCAELDMFILLDEAETLQDFEIQLSNGPYDLYVLDCRLPVDSGFVALEMLRERGLGGMSNVLMMSGMDIREFASAARLAGCRHFIEKSDLTSQSLRRVLEDLRTSAQQPVHHSHAAGRPDKMHFLPVVQTYSGMRHSRFAMGADGMVLRLDKGDQVFATQEPQALLDLAIEMLDADEFVFNT